MDQEFTTGKIISDFIHSSWYDLFLSYRRELGKEHEIYILVPPDGLLHWLMNAHLERNIQGDKVPVVNNLNGPFCTSFMPILAQTLRAARKYIKIMMFKFNAREVLDLLFDIFTEVDNIVIEILIDYHQNSSLKEVGVFVEFIKKCVETLNNRRIVPTIRYTKGTKVNHDKKIVCDDGNNLMIVLYGSFNLTPYGLTKNLEILKKSRDTELNKEWHNIFKVEFDRFQDPFCNIWYIWLNYYYSNVSLNLAKAANTGISYTTTREIAEEVRETEKNDLAIINWVMPYMIEKYPYIGYYAVIFMMALEVFELGSNVKLEDKVIANFYFCLGTLISSDQLKELADLYIESLIGVKSHFTRHYSSKGY